MDSARNERRIKQRAFLQAFAIHGTVRAACDAIDIGRRTHYDWMEEDAYAQAFERAREDFAERLEAEVTRRAVEGIEEPVFYKGEECGRVRKYSDNLLMFRLKGLKPQVYRENVSAELKLTGFEDLEEKLRAARKRIAAAALLESASN